MTGRSSPPPPTHVPIAIADGIRSSARRSPGKVALEEGARRLTYAELVERIDRVACGTAHGLGLQPGAHAAVMSPNCIEFVELVCGLASAGVPAALVNPRSTAAELAYILDDAEARVLFVHSSLEELARSAELRTVERIVVIGGGYEEWLSEARPVRPAVSLEEWDVFCIPYTAGTTGSPKGVLLSHRSRTLTFFSMALEYGCYTPDDRALAIAPLFHGAGFAFSVAPIFFAGSCVIMSKFDPERVLQLVAEHGITNTFMVPTHFNGLFALGEKVLARYDTGTIRTIISNAAPLSQASKERIVEHFGDTVLFEAYGSTEASIVTNLRPRDQLRKEQCVGLPAACTQIRLLDEQGDDVVPGDVGELHSRSPYLFNGYWNRPEETARSFHDGWCTAGDLARQDDEGYFYLVDRKHDQIISGGVNIYPREVEEALARHPAVAEAAVFGIPDDYWGESVHAVVALRGDARVTEAALLAYCDGHLSRYKRPKAIEFVPKLPRNAAGKVLRRELRDPFWAGKERDVN